MKTSILLIIFNRLETTIQVFNSIRKYKPLRLYIAADGPRNELIGEKEACNEVREWVLAHVDWGCEVKTLFRSENLGCGKAPSEAISWFFENENEGIILEDDCIAHPDFFTYCEQMLEYYRNNLSISIISGCNFDLKKQYCTENSYFYSVFPYTWGWATWKRNWEEYDYNISEWKNFNQMKFLKWVFREKKYRLAWKKILDNLAMNDQKGIWDYQFFFQCFKRRQLSIVPSVNLIKNVGTGELATHTTTENPLMNIELESLDFPLLHPVQLERNFRYDVFLQEINYGVVEQISLIKKIKRFIKRQIRLLQQ